MKTLKFKCELLSDVIINSKSATEGNRETLDFIPGNNFLGIAARKLYTVTNEKSWTLFHSGKVRFGDAHPCAVHTITRSLRVPANYFHPKLTGETERKVYVQNLIPESILDSEEFKALQPKQCRSGFYAFDGDTGWQVNPQKNFAIKSAYDRDKRRSADEEMFGYNALYKGTTFLFEVETDDDGLADELTQALSGIQRLGRSRTAQYGEVKISLADFAEISSQVSPDHEYMVYADGRLIFLDENNEPTFQPTARQLGFKKDTHAYVDWEKSQIRTFQYAPWNGTRHCYDTDRCGIEKGSVIVVHSSLAQDASSYVGAYNNEGFGKVIYNPSFLAADENGLARMSLKKDREELKQAVLPTRIGNAATPLLRYVDRQIHWQEIVDQVYKDVNDFVEGNRKNFNDVAFASQWGAIRDIAMKHHSKKSLEEELFTKTMDKTRRGTPEKEHKKVPISYLTHGVAADKWSKRGRLKKFKGFFDKLTDENAQLAIINLASEMAKLSEKKGKENRNDHK